MIRLVCPAGPVNPETFEAGVAVARSLEFAPSWQDDVFWRHGYFAGADQDRASALLAALDSGCDAIWMVRGGYGSVRTMAALGQDWSTGRDPVPLWAFSDGTALLAHWSALGWPGWLAPPLTQLARLDEDSLARVRAAFHAGHVAPFEDLVGVSGSGQATGPLAGGNLCVLTSLLATPYMPALAGHILVVEDTNEPAYRVDRLFSQLLYSGALDDIAGLVIGDFSAIAADQQPLIRGFFDEVAERLDVPVARGLPFGHDKRNAPLPIGAASAHVATLQVEAGQARLQVDRNGPRRPAP